MPNTATSSAVALLLFSLPIAAQATWTPFSVNGPSSRYFHAMAFDSQRGQTILFGGTPQSTNLGDTWEWSGTTWVQRATSGPAPRIQHSMAYDSTRGRTVLFGGWSGSTLLGDTWEWDGIVWHPHIFASGPAARFTHAMTFDSHRSRTVLFGGNSGTLRNDTWEWNGIAWTLVASTGPGARSDHAMAFDSIRSRTILFGGEGTAGYYGDTWEWDGSAWVQAATSGPFGRRNPAMTFDGRRSFLFGGLAGSNILADTWEWDGITWASVPTTGATPVGRYFHAMAHDTIRGKTVLFGGVGNGALADTWEWNGTSGTATAYGFGCGNPVMTCMPIVGSLPTIGTTVGASLTNLPSLVAFVGIGWSKAFVGAFPLPLPLASYGMPGCNLLQSSEAAAQPVTITGPVTATFDLPLPNWSGLVGLHIYLQAWANSPGANTANVVVSNGLEWAIGY